MFQSSAPMKIYQKTKIAELIADIKLESELIWPFTHTELKIFLIFTKIYM